MAGVSHAAPAHHFDGLKGLRTAIATRGYAIFEKSMKDGIAAAGPDKRDQAIGICRGYVNFATNHNALFNLIFDRPEMFTNDPEFTEASRSARQVLNDTSSQYVPGPGGASATEVTLFALAHGYAKLIEIGRVLPGTGDRRDVSIEDMFHFIELTPKPE
jgi:hypothetical protein